MTKPRHLPFFTFFVIFALISVVSVAVIDYLTFKDFSPIKAEHLISDVSLNVTAPSSGAEEEERISDIALPDPILPDADIVLETQDIQPPFFEAESIEPEYEPMQQEEDETGVYEDSKAESVDIPDPQEVLTVIPPVKVEGSPKISIIIDDIGMDIKHSREVLDLPSAVTLAILPYAEKAPLFASEGLAKGHEIIIHTPMEPMNPDLDLGSMALRTDVNDEEFKKSFDEILNSFEGYVGINNHMGSKMTQDAEGMARVMNVLKQKGLYFVDSKTISTSVAAKTARMHGVPYAERDVFLDHESTPEFVMNALKKLEVTAQKNGYAIAIGHPKQATIEGLKKWIPEAQAKGFEIVPVSSLLIRPDAPRADLPAQSSLPPPG